MQDLTPEEKHRMMPVVEEFVSDVLRLQRKFEVQRLALEVKYFEKLPKENRIQWHFLQLAEKQLRRSE
ncbi:MAG: hypothetical protein G01um101430_712 [Parcubacteria group bacterium Gr01-1014_30]|nr:MAG: hypothetical protein G01um101430_712 [Parcubacteria group bacterium Gr01-1014_30]